MIYMWIQHEVRRCTILCILIAYLLKVRVAAARPSLSSSSAISVRSGMWSEPEVWQARRLPQPGDTVIIAEGTLVRLDTNVSISTLTVSGSGAVLSCLRNNDLSVPSELVLDISRLFLVEKGGCFACGAGDCTQEPEQYAGKLKIRFTSATPPASADEDVRTLLVREGGTLHLSGLERSPAISRLAAHARSNALSIDVSDATGWRPGDVIAIAPTDYNPSETEYRRIVDISIMSGETPPATVLLDRPLLYSHNGHRLVIPGSPKGAGAFLLDTRAEVAMLSRNIVIEGVVGDLYGLGGDVKILGSSSRILLKWCELRFLGRRGHLGRYPLHLHGAADGAVIAGVSVHDSYQRGIVLHCTNRAHVLDTVVASVYGFAFMLEDGAEEDNALHGNLALDVLNAIPNTSTVITEHGNPAGFWFVNPANSFVGNMAAGIPGSGYSWEMIRNRTASYTLCPQQVPGYDVGLFSKQQYYALDASVYGALMRKNFAVFRNNSAHSMNSGIWFRGTGEQNARLFYPPFQSRIDEFTAWKLVPRTKAPPGVEGWHHDGCLHVANLARLRFFRSACVNSARVYWSSESNVLNDTLMAWVGADDEGTEMSLLPGSYADDKWRYNQAMTSYRNPQTFVNTHVRGKYGRAIFQIMGAGSITSANTIVSGFSFDANTVLPNFDLAFMSSQSPHVFTDEDGEWLGAGPGARVLASCPGCGATVDPIIDAYAPGACLPVGKEVASNAEPKQYMSDPRPGSGGVIRAAGATPLLCAGPAAPMMSVIQLRVQPISTSAPSLEFNILTPKGRFLRTATMSDTYTACFVAPMTKSSVSAYGGYRIISPTAWSGIRTLFLSMGPMADIEIGGMTIVLSGIPARVRTSTAPVNISFGGSCATLVAECGMQGVDRIARVGPCLCRDSFGDIHVRLITDPGIQDTSAYDRGGSMYLFESTGLQLNWD
jgi:hypothetical protein